jgi:hypothetical protein
MKRLTTYLTIFIKKLFSFLQIEETTNKKIIWENVPSSCKSKEEKEIILFDLINRLEHKIKIIK